MLCPMILGCKVVPGDVYSVTNVSFYDSYIYLTCKKFNL